MKITRFIVVVFIFLSASICGQVSIDSLKKHTDYVSNIIDNGDYEKAKIEAEKLLQLSLKSNYKIGVAESYNYKGIIDRDQASLRDALDNYLKALALFEELKMPVKVAGIQNNIGLIYAEIKEYRTALSYYFKAVKINIERDKKSNLAINYNNIATCYQKLKQFSSAQTYLSRSLTLRQEVNDTIGMAMAYHNLGINQQLTENKDSAIACFNKSLSYLNGMSENIGHAYNYLELGNTYLQLGKLNDAEKYLLSSLRISENSELESIKGEVCKHLSNLYFKKEDFKKAYTYQGLYLTLKDNIESAENKNELVKKELEYDFSKKQELQRKDAENKQAMAEAEIRSQQKLITLAVIGLIILSGLVLLVFRGYKHKQKANEIISKQKELVEHKNKEIVDSINYAKYIQTALLPSDTMIKNLPFNCFVLFKPKDIVSGDFYWLHEQIDTTTQNKELYIAAVDCTGHGVPGAMVSVVGNNGLNRCVKEFNIHNTGKILDKLSELVEETFEKSEKELKDGMDISLLKLELIPKMPNKVNVQWSGANNPLWIIKKGTQNIEEIISNKQPVGKFFNKKDFTTHYFTFDKGDRLFIFTDGYADQFGGPKGKKFMYKQFKEVLLNSSTQPLLEQKNALDKAFLNWKQDADQVDDVCIIAIEI